MSGTGLKIIFETSKTIVRAYTAGDQENFFRMNGDEEIVRYIRPAKSPEECDIFLLEVIKYSDANPLYGRWAVIEKGTGGFLGTFAIIPVGETNDMQVGYSLVKEAWGRGYATELTRAGILYFFKITTKNELYAFAEAENSSSHRVLLKCGFVQSASPHDRPDNKEIFEYILKRS